MATVEEGDSGQHHKSKRRCEKAQERRLTQPVVDPEIRSTVPQGKVRPAIGAADKHEHGPDDGQTEVAEPDQVLILRLVQRARRVEVVDASEEAVALATAAALALTLVVVVAGDVGRQVDGPAAELLAHHVDERRDRGLLDELRQLVRQTARGRGKLLPPLGHEDHVTLEVGRGLVVLAVRDLPGEVRHQQGRVADPADGVVQDLGRRERLVAALVRQDPEPGAEETLHEGVQRPEDAAEQDRGDLLGRHEAVEEVERDREAGHVPGDVPQAPQRRAFEAAGRDRIVDVSHRIVGDGEGIAVRIHKLAVGRFFRRGQRRQRRGRARADRGVDGGGHDGAGGRFGQRRGVRKHRLRQ